MPKTLFSMSFRRKNSRRKAVVVRISRRPARRGHRRPRKPLPSKKVRLRRYNKAKRRAFLRHTNTMRKKLALDPVPKRRHRFVPVPRGHQWYDYSTNAYSWSFVCTEFREVARTDDDYNLTARPGNVARFLPSVLNFRITHSTSSRGEATYRFIMLKFLEMAATQSVTTGTDGRALSVNSTMLTRENILEVAADANEWRHSTYTRAVGRGDDTPKWTVVYDKVFTFNNNGDRSSTKMLQLNLRGGTVEYREDSSDGVTAKGHYVLLVLTTAGAMSSDRTFDFDYNVQFTSSGG